MRFWLDMGVDALRMDAIPYLVERDGTTCENLPETHKVIKIIRAAIDAEYANRLILAEANQWPADVRPYFGDGDECHMAFHFPLMPRIYMALRQEDRLPITDIMAQTPAIPDKCQWGLFLRNHDELTLEMVTDDERDYMYFAYSADPRMRVNVGIRRRLAPLVDNNRRRIELLNSLLLSFPGTPILYYGDEIGMGDNIYLGDRNGVRTPMQWNSDRNAGFSRCDPARLYFPVVMDPIFGYQVINVEAQLSDPSSLLHWTRNMIALRKLFQVFGRGSLKFLNPTNRKILAYLRSIDREDGSNETVLCVANLSRFAQPVSLDLADFAGSVPVEMLGYVPFPAIAKSPYALTLAPYSFLWLELQPAIVDLDAARPEQQVAVEEEVPVNEDVAHQLAANGWTGLLVGRRLELLEVAIANWLPQQRWFGSKIRKILATHILQWTEVPTGESAAGTIEPSAEPRSARNAPAALLFVQITYPEGASDIYQLPVAFSTGAEAQDLTASNPQSILIDLSSAAGPAVLHEASIREDFRQCLLSLIERNATLPIFAARIASDGEPGTSVAANDSERSMDRDVAQPCLEAHASTAFSSARSSESLSSRVGSAEQSNTSILYGKQMILKMFRRLQPGNNPDVEIGRFLTDASRFSQIAPFLGEITIASPDGENTVIAMLQKLVANNGDGWQWFLNQLDGFFASVQALGDAPEAPAPSFLNEREPVREMLDHAQTSLEAAELLGRRTAGLHLALARPTSDPAFASESFTREDLDGDARRIETQITSTLEALRIKIASLPETIADSAALVLSRRLDLLARSRAITSVTAAGQRIRIHGDYHLGQVLRTPASGNETSNGADDFVILDFEGEPARPLAERRRKQSPLRDVAGMMRSLSYAAHAGLNQYLKRKQGPAEESSSETLLGWALLWHNSVASEFLRSYREAVSVNRDLLPSPQDSQTILGAYLLEKGMYELLYELNNRPDWLHVPLAGILDSYAFGREESLVGAHRG
jgi:maltose alpha-D-glucosyltransferase/alpha-amylase